MNNLYVTSRKVIERINFGEDKDQCFVISITDPESRLAKISLPESHVYRASFYDITEPIYTIDMLQQWFPIADDQAESIATFVLNHYTKKSFWIVHCEAGISRSAGVAAAISKYYSDDDSYYFKNKCPNMVCYTKVLKYLKILGLEGNS